MAEVLTSLLQSLLIKQCIFITLDLDNLYEILLKVKQLSGKQLLTAHFSLFKFVEYIDEINFAEVKSTIILKIKNDFELSYLLNELRLRITYKEICSKFVWILLLQQNGSRVSFDDFHVPFNCEFFILQKSDAGYDVTEIYQIRNGSAMIAKKFGRCSGNQSLAVDERGLYQRRNNLQGKTMIMELMERNISTYVTWSIHHRLWLDMGNILNFSAKFMKPIEVQQNLILPDLKLEIGYFHAAANNTHQEIGPIMAARGHLYIRDIGEDAAPWNTYLQPFGIKLWLAMIGWISASAGIYTLIGWVSIRKLASKGHHITLLDVGLTSLTTLCNQSCDYANYAISLRIAKINAFVVSGIIIPAYSAFIVSYLTVDKVKIPFTDFETFVKGGTYKLAALDISVTVSYFKNNDNPVIQTIREKYLLDYDKFPENHEKSIDMVCNIPKLAMLNFNYKMIQKGSSCKITMIPTEVIKLFTAIQLKNNGIQYRKVFQNTLVKFRSAGVINKEEKIMLGRTDFRTVNKDFGPIELDTIKSLTAILSIGMIISFQFFMLEIFYSKFRNGE